MKRNDNIVWLSRDHHSGLLCSWKVRQGVKKEIEPGRIKKYILYFFENHLEDHFKAEEEVLFPYLEDAYTLRIRSEHQQIKMLIYQIEASGDPNLFSYFASLLELHIRFEERHWFPHLEEKLNNTDLNKIGRDLDDIHTDKKEIYDDEFWK